MMDLFKRYRDLLRDALLASPREEIIMAVTEEHMRGMQRQLEQSETNRRALERELEHSEAMLKQKGFEIEQLSK